MVDANGRHKRGRYEKKLWLKSLPVMFTLKVFVTQDGRTTDRSAKHDSLYRSICYSYGLKMNNNKQTTKQKKFFLCRDHRKQQKLHVLSTQKELKLTAISGKD